MWVTAVGSSITCVVVMIHTLSLIATLSCLVETLPSCELNTGNPCQKQNSEESNVNLDSSKTFDTNSDTFECNPIIATLLKLDDLGRGLLNVITDPLNLLAVPFTGNQVLGNTEGFNPSGNTFYLVGPGLAQPVAGTHLSALQNTESVSSTVTREPPAEAPPSQESATSLEKPDHTESLHPAQAQTPSETISTENAPTTGAPSNVDKIPSVETPPTKDDSSSADKASPEEKPPTKGYSHVDELPTKDAVTPESKPSIEKNPTNTNSSPADKDPSKESSLKGGPTPADKPVTEEQSPTKDTPPPPQDKPSTEENKLPKKDVSSPADKPPPKESPPSKGDNPPAGNPPEEKPSSTDNPLTEGKPPAKGNSSPAVEPSSKEKPSNNPPADKPTTEEKPPAKDVSPPPAKKSPAEEKTSTKKDPPASDKPPSKKTPPAKN